jgi:hypothetical protein
MKRALLAAAVAALSLAGPSVSAQNGFGTARSIDSYVQVDWQPGQTRKGAPIISGRAHNLHGMPIARVRLAVQELSPSGGVASTTTGYVDGPIAPLGDVYFEVRVPRANTQYRVTVLHFELLTDPGVGM